MKIASIDIGTNTVLLLIVEILPDGSWRVLSDIQRIIRLGRNVDASRTIQPGGFDACAAVLSEYGEIIRNARCETTSAFGTSFLRDASNRDAFIEAMFNRTGIRIGVLSGEDEALWTFHGGRLVLDAARRDEPGSVIDIGGGSTEFITGSASSILFKKSLDIGAVRLTERFIHHDPVLPDEASQLREYLRDILAEQLAAMPPCGHLIGVAGTITTIAAMKQELRTYDPDRINGYVLPIDALRSFNRRLASTDLSARRAWPGLQPERADVILAGALILEESLTFLNSPAITVSDHGLRYGLILRQIDQMKKGSR